MDGGGPELQPAGSFEWVRVIDVCDFDSAAVVQKLSPKHRPAARTIAGVAYRLALWADANGSNLRPSAARVAVVCRIDQKTARTVLGILRDLGLLDQLARGYGSRSPLYRLSVPTDLLDRLHVLTPADLDDRVRALSARIATTKGRSASGGGEPDVGGCTPDLEADSGGCTPEVPVEGPSGASEFGGMPTIPMADMGGCPPGNGGMHTPHQPETDQLTPPTKTSPLVGSSPARASPTDHDAHPQADRIAALREAARGRRTA